jgi:hypothetical protein
MQIIGLISSIARCTLNNRAYGLDNDDEVDCRHKVAIDDVTHCFKTITSNGPFVLVKTLALAVEVVEEKIGGRVKDRVECGGKE